MHTFTLNTGLHIFGWLRLFAKNSIQGVEIHILTTFAFKLDITAKTFFTVAKRNFSHKIFHWPRHFPQNYMCHYESTVVFIVVYSGRLLGMTKEKYLLVFWS